MRKSAKAWKLKFVVRGFSLKGWICNTGKAASTDGSGQAGPLSRPACRWQGAEGGSAHTASMNSRGQCVGSGQQRGSAHTGLSGNGESTAAYRGVCLGNRTGLEKLSLTPGGSKLF